MDTCYHHTDAPDLPLRRSPTDRVARPHLKPDYTATIGLDRNQTRALIAAGPRDRNSSLEPNLVRKRQRRRGPVECVVICSVTLTING
jgi:hypothetical protein